MSYHASKPASPRAGPLASVRVVPVRLGLGLVLLALLAAPAVARAQASPTAGRIDVVLDPGHGGTNTGSPGRGEMLEKRATLALAKQVRRRLIAAGLSVQLTRTRDVYVPIRARARIANALGPRCFISLHTNASADHARRGIETYLLSREAIDIRARRAALAAGSDTEALVAEQRVLAAASASLRLAAAVQRHLLGGGSSHSDGTSYFPVDRGVRQAAHDVLADVDGPAILVEAGFLDHPIEGRLLASPEGQAEVARRIADGILSYLASGKPSDPAGPLAAR